MPGSEVAKMGYATNPNHPRVTMTAKYDVSGAATIFAAAHHKRMREAYAKDQIAAARALCGSVLDAATSRGFEIAADGDNTWTVSACKYKGNARVAITDQGDIQVSTRQLESPRPLKIRYDAVAKSFVGTDDSNGNPATALANAIVAALDEGWERDSRTGLKPIGLE
jgi:hypothetical protein